MKKPLLNDPAFRITFIILVILSIILFFWAYSHRHFGESRLTFEGWPGLLQQVWLVSSPRV